MRPGVYVVVHDDRQEIYAHLELAVDAAGAPVPEAWVARPLRPEEVAELRARGPREPARTVGGLALLARPAVHLVRTLATR